MNAAVIITLAVSFGVLPAAVVAMPLLRQRMHRDPVEPCPGCGYEVHLTEPDTRCPECGYKRSHKLLHRGPSAAAIAYRIVVAVLAPGLTAMVSASVSLIMQPTHKVSLVVLVCCAPYVIPLAAVIAMYRPRAGDADALAKVLLGATAGCNVGMAWVMYWYWNHAMALDDAAWPLTNLMIYAGVLGLVVFFPGCVVAAFMNRKR